MAVRIALQCSEADAHLILSEDNTAARLLTRPGEAIYNDANGLYEGNHPFQVVWLTDDGSRRLSGADRRVGPARGTSRRRRRSFSKGTCWPTRPTTRGCAELLDGAAMAGARARVPAWLGSAVAIKDPTAAVFLRQNGSNLLLVGHREEAALGVMASCFISLAAQLPPRQASPHPFGREGTKPKPRFYILDGMRPDAPEVGFWNRLAAVAPQAVKLADVRDAAEIDRGNRRRSLPARQQQPPTLRRPSTCSSTTWAASAT